MRSILVKDLKIPIFEDLSESVAHKLCLEMQIVEATEGTLQPTLTYTPPWRDAYDPPC